MSKWEPADSAPFDVKVNARFQRDGETIERPMTRLLPKLWWDERYCQYAHTTPIQFSKLEAA